MHAKKLFFKSIGVMVVIAMLMAILPINSVAAQASDVGPALQTGADRLVALQNNDGGWDWPLDNADPDSGSAANIIGPIAQGLAMAYLHTGDAAHLAALVDAGAFLLAKTNNFSPSDGYLAATLDEILGGTTYKDHVIANFYGPLVAGTYDRNGAGTLYNTAEYIQMIQDIRSGATTNLGAWDIGMGLVGAALCGADTSEWIAATKDEINLLDDYTDVGDPLSYLPLGLSGALYGLAVVGEDIAPTAGYFAGSANINALFDALAGFQNASGGVVWHPDYMLENDQNENTQATAYTILAFNEFDRAAYLGNIQPAADYLLGIQLATGGWDNYPAVGTYEASGENNEVTAEALWGISVAYPELWVCETGDCGHPGAQFDTIQGAVDAAAVGTTIYVAAGTYAENLTINKGLTLLGDGRDTTTIQGVAPITDSGSFTIAASDVTVDGFEILGIGQKLIRITQTVENVQFLNNRVIGAENTGSAGGWALFESNYNLNQTDLVIDNNIFVGNNATTLVYLNPQLINLVFTNNTFTGTMMPNGLVVGMEGLDGNQVITGNTFDIESTYALFEAFGTYDIVGIFDANTWREGYIPTGNLVAPISLVYPSTNDINRTNGWAHVNVVSVDKDAGTMTVEFVSPRTFVSCFEYRTDGDTSQVTGNANYNEAILDGLYPFYCVNNATRVETIELNQFVEIRLSFGPESDERFYWTRFDLVTDLWVCPTGDCGHEGLEFASIQEAIDAAYGGATIHVMAGTYNDVGGNTIPVEKQGLTIVLEDSVVVENNSPAFIINADYTTITTTSLLGAKLVPTNGSNAIDVNGDRLNIVIEGLEIDGADGTNGIDFDGVVTDLVIRDNYIHSLAGDGIFFAAQPAGTVHIQGNLLMGNGLNGIEAGDHVVPAQYNAWGHVDGAALGDGASANVDWTNWTHVDLYLESTNPDVDNWANQVFVGETITYEVKANLANVMGADFVLHYPAELSIDSTSLGDSFDLETLTPGSGQVRFEGWQMGSETTDPSLPLSGEYVLFTVTFTADTAKKDLILNLDETSDLFSMSPGYGPSSNIYAVALDDITTLDVITRPTLTADANLAGPYVAGLRHEFSTTIANLASGGEWIESLGTTPEPDAIAWIRISDITAADIHSLQFMYGGGWVDFSDQPGTVFVQDGDDLLVRFGNDLIGFDIGAPSSETDDFAVTFINPGTHEVTFEIYDMMDTAADRSDDILLTDLGPVTITVDGNFNVTGTVSMQGRSVRSGVLMTLTTITVPDYGPFNATSTNVISNNLLFTGLNGGTYLVTTNQARYLNIPASMGIQVAVSGDRTLAALELKGGNARWDDNVINIQDASKVSSDYGQTIDTDGDVNFDGIVNIQDLALVGGNFDLTSAVAYGSWTP